MRVPPGDDSLAPHGDWKKLWFVLDHEAFYEVCRWSAANCSAACEVSHMEIKILGVNTHVPRLLYWKVDKPEERLSKSFSRRGSNAEPSSPSLAKPPTRPSILRIELEEIVFMTPCADLSLPPGGGFRIDTNMRQQYLVSHSLVLPE